MIKKKTPPKPKAPAVLKEHAKPRLYHLALESAEFADKHNIPFVAFVLQPGKKTDAVATDRAVCIANANEDFLHQAITALFMQHSKLAKRMMKEMLIGNTDADGNLVQDDPMPEIVLPFSESDLVKIHPPAPGAEPDSEFLTAFHGREATMVMCGPKASTVRLRNDAGDMITLAFDNYRLEKVERVLQVVHDEPEEIAVDVPANRSA